MQAARRRARQAVPLGAVRGGADQGDGDGLRLQPAALAELGHEGIQADDPARDQSGAGKSINFLGEPTFPNHMVIGEW